MKEDRNFDDIAHKFAKNIYGSTKGEIRQAVVWQDMESLLAEHPKQSLTVLDAGGGLGHLSRQLAQLGHNIILCDVSQEMLALARIEVEREGLLERFQFLHCGVQDLTQKLPKPVDLVLFHAVMEWLKLPFEGLSQVLACLKPQGYASIMFYNQTGLLFKNLTCGNLTHIEQGMPHRKRFKLQPQKGLVPEEVYAHLHKNDFVIKGKTGVRTFHDYMQNNYLGDYTEQQLIAMEQSLCRQEPFVSLGRYIHVWGQMGPAHSEVSKDIE
ncbi:tRNA uridine 5-oxyacetic acid(34) methyltransferase CmoM [Thaumasiovibrio sp. DFM-14]|uniref:tRNA uridine 5-oxyacetic acid(34) methyltransferase CmoM n=1 Tax=Thaumasiovibrio sp. DFM-14 TaxID=3384792 RepID=UPI00399F5CC5